MLQTSSIRISFVRIGRDDKERTPMIRPSPRIDTPQSHMAKV